MALFRKKLDLAYEMHCTHMEIRLLLSNTTVLSFLSFECGSCRKTWPSARVVVLFHYRLRGERGTVIMRPLGQSCRRCQDTFELPGFSEDVVRGTLQRLFSKIRKNIYDEDDDDDDGGHSDNSRRGWSKPHESSLCEACNMGICSQNDECEG